MADVRSEVSSDRPRVRVRRAPGEARRLPAGEGGQGRTGTLSRAARIAARVEASPGLLAAGYGYLRTLHAGDPASGGRGVIQARLAGRPALIAGGQGAVRLFYSAAFKRAGATPLPLRSTLFSRGGVQDLDGAEHHHRRDLFLQIMSPDRVRGLADRADREWDAAMARWSPGTRVVLFDEAVRVLGRAVLDWAGLECAPGEADRRARDLAAAIEGAGGPGPRYVRARRARRRAERWAAAAVEEERRRGTAADPAAARPLQLIAGHRDLDGARLDVHTAAVELLNVLRPTVAVAWLVTRAGLALLERPDCRVRLATREATDHGAAQRAELATSLVHEVRRVYPMVPAIAAIARDDVSLGGHGLRRGGRLLLDLDATDTDPAVWPAPLSVAPERFWTPASTVQGRPPVHGYERLVPQGGGDVTTGHRCPGEAATVELLRRALPRLARLDLGLPPQDLRMHLRRMPTRPRSGLVLAIPPRV